MNAILKPITTKVLKRPSFEHPEWLGFDRGSWIDANREALRTWWRETGDGKTGSPDFDYFCIWIYESESAAREELKREWATLPRDRRRD